MIETSIITILGMLVVKETNKDDHFCFLIGDLIVCGNQFSRNSPAVSVRASQQPPVPPSKLSQRNQATVPLPVVTPRNQQTEKR